MLERILLHALFGFVDVDQFQHLDRTFARLRFGAVGMQHDRLHQLMSDRIGRIQRGHGILEDDRDLVAANGLHDGFIRADELLPVKLDGTGYDLAGCGKNLHDGIRGDGFARAGLADDAEHLAAVEVEGYAVDGFDFTRGGKEGCMQIAYFQ